MVSNPGVSPVGYNLCEIGPGLPVSAMILTCFGGGGG